MIFCAVVPVLTLKCSPEAASSNFSQVAAVSIHAACGLREMCDFVLQIGKLEQQLRVDRILCIELINTHLRHEHHWTALTLHLLYSPKRCKDQ